MRGRTADRWLIGRRLVRPRTPPAELHATNFPPSLVGLGLMLVDRVSEESGVPGSACGETGKAYERNGPWVDCPFIRPSRGPTAMPATVCLYGLFCVWSLWEESRGRLECPTMPVGRLGRPFSATAI